MVRPGVLLKLMTLPGARNLLMSEKNRFDRPTPTNGPGRSIANTGREMLLDDESGGARCESVLIAAEIGRRPSLRDAARDLFGGRLSAAHIPDTEDIAFAIGHCDNAVRRNLKGARDRLIDNGLDIGGRELRAPGQAGQSSKPAVRKTIGRELARGSLHTKRACLGLSKSERATLPDPDS